MPPIRDASEMVWIFKDEFKNAGNAGSPTDLKQIIDKKHHFVSQSFKFGAETGSSASDNLLVKCRQVELNSC